MFKRIVLGLLGLAIIAVIGIFVLAWKPAIDEIPPPASGAFAPELVARGEVLAGAGYCATCHTAAGGRPYAGRLPMDTGFGTIYSTNITPDPQTGIGHWSEQAFARALREGVARDGSQLFPALPYQHFALVTDEDVKALYAYLMTRAPVVQDNTAPDMPFPLNVRALQAGWKLLFVRDGEFGITRGEVVAAKSAQWNRGAYLGEGLGHCSSCHSPRNRLGAEATGKDRYNGNVLDGWYAPPLNPTNKAPVPWTEEALFNYLRTGADRLHGVAAGSMSNVVHAGLVKLPDDDVRAIAAYYADWFGTAGKPRDDGAAVAAKVLASSAAGSRQQADPGATLYTAACASCHYNSGPMPLVVRPELGLNSALTADDPSTLIQIILHGINMPDGLPDTMMPGFSHSLDDAQVAQLAAWLRSHRTDRPPWPDLQHTVSELRARPAAAGGAQ